MMIVVCFLSGYIRMLIGSVPNNFAASYTCGTFRQGFPDNPRPPAQAKPCLPPSCFNTPVPIETIQVGVIPMHKIRVL